MRASDVTRRLSRIATGPDLRDLKLLASQFAARPALWCNGREIAHAHDDGSLDVRLTRAAIRARRPLPEGVEQRSGGDWIEIAADVPVRIARALLVAAAEAHRALPVRIEPTPARVAARQRLHRGPVTK